MLVHDGVGPILAEPAGGVDELVRGRRDGLVGEDRESAQGLGQEGRVGLVAA